MRPQGAQRGNDGSIRTLKGWFARTATTSSKPASDVLAEVKRVLQQMDIAYEGDGFSVVCDYLRIEGNITFEIEVCQLQRLNLLVGLKFKRISGPFWAYKRMCSQFITHLAL